MRRHDRGFREMTACFDYFIPDGMPLIWCLNARGAGLRDRVYGPTFMRVALETMPTQTTHYFLGGNEECLSKLKEAALRMEPGRRIVGSRNGYFSAADEPGILEEINLLAPDFVWVGLGTPKQQDWINRHRGLLKRGVVMAVGFAFDVNAGTKTDAPLWMQRRGLTWLYRMCSEPRRLFSRYLKFNSLFLWYLLIDGIRGRAFRG
jgi:N-acetylglucosaminyldiphosphoundecaprenol N-acetyl-beta-D-mannosaminyltransferase